MSSIQTTTTTGSTPSSTFSTNNEPEPEPCLKMEPPSSTPPASPAASSPWVPTTLRDDQDAAQFRRQLSELQPTLTIGALGHASHGKSTLVGRLTNVKTARHSKEQARNMTIKLGYANAKIYRCDDGECPKPACYTPMASNTKGKPRCHCGSTMTLARHVSFVDCPGHEMLMSVMLNAASAMDAAILVVAANEECPRPQTAEHLAAADLMNLGRYVVIQNKVDLVSEENARKSYLDIRGFTQGTGAERSPVIPISAQLGYNVDVVCQYIAEQVPEPEHDLSLPPLLNVRAHTPPHTSPIGG